jgi:hypothetical protein
MLGAWYDPIVRSILAALAVALVGCGPPAGDTAQVSLSQSTAQPQVADFAGFGGWFSPTPHLFVAQVESAQTGEVLALTFAAGAFPLGGDIGAGFSAELAIGFADGRPLWQAEGGNVVVSGDPASHVLTIRARDLVFVASSPTAMGTVHASVDGTFQSYVH